MVRVAVVLAAVILAACSSGKGTGTAATSAPPASESPSGNTDVTFANGATIFRTGRDSDGLQITAKPPSLFPSCAACHRTDGSGGVHLPGGAVSADLRHKALVTDQKAPYTLALLERAVSSGVDNTGQPLNRVMPHWKLSKRDLHDVALYVLTALK